MAIYFVGSYFFITFVAKLNVEGFGLIATTIKNAKTAFFIRTRNPTPSPEVELVIKTIQYGILIYIRVGFGGSPR